MSRLQNIARARNSSKGRIKGLRNNIRGMLEEETPHLTDMERHTLEVAEEDFNIILKEWDQNYEQIKANL